MPDEKFTLYTIGERIARLSPVAAIIRTVQNLGGSGQTDEEMARRMEPVAGPKAASSFLKQQSAVREGRYIDAIGDAAATHLEAASYRLTHPLEVMNAEITDIAGAPSSKRCQDGPNTRRSKQ